MQVLIGFVLLAVAGALLALRVEPVPTWFYVFAWYPVLVILDGWSRRGNPPEASWLRGARAASLYGWSIIIWLAYEVANFRLQNWYYVNLPRPHVERWTGILVSFATVVPAILLAERLLDRVGLGKRWRTRPFPAAPWHWRVIVVMGVAIGAAALVTPRYLSPLIWGAGFLIFDPLVRSRTPHRSLLAAVADGAPGRVGRLLVSGLAIGVLWESLNHLARARWIYTVPFLEELKLFEMPPVGFLGFPFFALSAYSGYHALVAAGVAVDPRQPGPVRRFRTGVAAVLCAVGAVIVLSQMDDRSVSSTVARLSDVPGLDTLDLDRLAEAGFRDPADLAAADPVALGPLLGTTDSQAVRVVNTAELVTLRGMGTTHVRELARTGIVSVCDLARADPFVVWQEIHALFRGLGPRPTQAEVRVWHRAARRACPR